MLKPHVRQVCELGSHRFTTCCGPKPQAFTKPCSNHSMATGTMGFHVHLSHAPPNIACLPQQLDSEHRASAGDAYNISVRLTVQSPRPSALGQTPPTGCPLPTLQCTEGCTSRRGSALCANRQQLQVAHCLPDAGL